MTFNELKKNIKKDFTGFKQIRLALLGDSSTQLLAQSIRGLGYEKKLNINVFDADYNQIERLIVNLSSELYIYNPDYIVIFEASHKLLLKFNKLDEADKYCFAENEYERIDKYIKILQKNIKSKIIFCNYPEEDDAVFGNFANKIEISFLYQQRKLNYLISELSVVNNDLNICDLSSIQNKYGRNILYSSSIYVNTDMVISVDALPLISNPIVQIIAVHQGMFKKCLILDLDNTIWGGIIGDDGIDNIKIGSLGIGKAFTELQYWIKKLRQRGIIICICSKNTENIAKEPFEKHPEMVLRLNDIAVFVANWNNKADNIIGIQKILNIGFDSMVFLDDNEFERDMVRKLIPEITVPDLPSDPADYLEFLYELNLFETASYSSEDSKRTAQYKMKCEIETELSLYENECDFLKSLNMISDVKELNSFSTPRIAQLSQRSNQYNLRTVRYNEKDIQNIIKSKDFFSLSFTLEDKYGDNGIICAVILRKIDSFKLFIDTWFMSCRVLKRGMENFVLNTIVEYALGKGYQTIVGEYIPTEKNIIVKDHYANLGFKRAGSFWELNIREYEEKECFIIKKEK